MSILDDLKHWEEQTPNNTQKIKLEVEKNNLKFIEKLDYMFAIGIYSTYYIFHKNGKFGVSIDKDYTENYEHNSYKIAVEYANKINDDDIDRIIKNLTENSNIRVSPLRKMYSPFN